MFKCLGCILIYLPLCSYAGTFYDRPATDTPKYVCFDGRTLVCTNTGYIWEANRGCFISKLPCEARLATPYGYFPVITQLMQAYARCRANYPFHLGEMQTH